MKRVSYGLQERGEDFMNNPRFKGSIGIFQPSPPGYVWLNYKGTFSVENLYKLVYETLKKFKYSDTDGQKDKIEHYYFEKVGPDGTKGEVWYWWRTLKPGKVIGNDAFDYRLNIDVQILGLKSVTQTTKDGQKFKSNYGEISFFISPFLDLKLDPKKSKMPSLIWHWFRKRVYHNQVQERKKEIYTEANIVYGLIKQYLGLENFTPIPPEFHPKGGIPMYKIPE